MLKRLIVPLMLASTVCYGQEPRVVQPITTHTFSDRRVRDEAKLPHARLDVYVAEYEPTKSEKKLLAPATEDLQAYAEFLLQPDTGLTRIFPAQPRKLVSVDQLESGQRPGFINFASTYSFSKTKHGHALQGYVDPGLGWAELKLDSDMLITAFTRSSVGLLVSLGDMPLESITVST